MTHSTTLEETAKKSRWKPTTTDARFWGALLALNFLLFLPLYLLNIETSNFGPFLSVEAANWRVNFNRLVFWRNNFDLFRYSIELLFLVAIWVAVKPLRHRFLRWAIFALYLVAFYYYVYEAIAISFFLVDPIFYNQYYLALDGLGFLAQHVQLPFYVYLLGIALFVGLHVVIAWLVRQLFDEKSGPRLSIYSLVLFFGLVLLAGGMAVRYQVTLANPIMSASSVSYKVQKNIKDSIQVRADTLAFDGALVERVYDYSDFMLAERPNIYLIFVESYGGILYKRADYKRAYLELLDELEADLVGDGWHMASNLSESPTWGGGSWMAYASTLFGLRIETHPQFLFLRNQYQFADYPDLGHYLKRQGYRYHRLSAMSVEMTEYEWEQYQRFYGVDEWLRFRDMGFGGARYGWGPSPPDQYSVNLMRERMTAASDDPFLFFFITQNSHYPWTPLPPIVDDWRTLNSLIEPTAQGNQSGGDSHDITRQNYFDAIEYELRFLTDFVRNDEEEDSIFILIGDHQPPRVARKADGFETPIHILSRDAALVESLGEYGFVDGLRVQNHGGAVKHESLYSMLMRVLIANYGEDPTILPPYLPDGVDFNQNAEQVDAN